MNAIALSTKDNVSHQSKTLIVTPNDRSVVLKVKLDWRQIVDKWFMTIWDVATGECLISNIPLLCSCQLANDLLGQFHYLRIGSSFVATAADELYGVDPRLGNLSSYEVIWGDCFGT